jgi:toxin FitB
MKYLLDTCVPSELLKKIPNPGVVDWLRECNEDHLFISVLTLGEIQKGIAKLTDQKRKHKMQMWLDMDLVGRFTSRILSITDEIAMTWGELQAASEVKGLPVPTIDGLLAATALVNNLVVVTRNLADIQRTGAQIFNPWR